MVQKVTLKEQLAEQLQEKGTLTSDDLKTLQPPRPEPEDGGNKETPVKERIPVSGTDPLVDGASDTASDRDVASDMFRRATIPDDQFGLAESISLEEITEDDKERFMTSFVDGTRFTRPFSILAGRVTGVFRCRTAGESRAIIEELIRQTEKANDSVYGHSTKLRYALIHCQLAELNHVVRPEWQPPLMAVQRVENGMGKIEDPKWYTEMQVLFDGKLDAWVNALFAELKRFEGVYWYLITKAADQDFWRPGVSIIESPRDFGA